jgi:hypothetical protein
MIAVYKFPLSTQKDLEIDMPQGATILTVQIQENEPQMWAVVDSMAEPEARHFRVLKTGDPIDNPDELIYLGSFQIDHRLIYHVFEVSENN